ncbi:MAG: DUF2071 domain-containing protein [Verrucomicrobiae bacterium]|nr:DUF2071 domain-containing protein [Verrucomicrobiae bacterium]
MIPTLPRLAGTIERRILVNCRVRPDVIAPWLPAPFRPQLVKGWAMAGICLIRMRGVRPRGLPEWCGLGSENAAHRIAVEWDGASGTQQGVYIPRRDTDSALNYLLGGRVFPGAHHRARFEVWESPNRFRVGFTSADGGARVRFVGRVVDDWPAGSVFGSLAEASAFFVAGCCGWSPKRAGTGFEGMRLDCHGWRMEPLLAERVDSGFFQNRGLFPAGSVEFDSAQLMRNIAHEWTVLKGMRDGNKA